MIEGRVVTLLVGALFRVLEILFRGLHLSTRTVRLFVQKRLTARVDRVLARAAKRRLAKRATVDNSSIVFITMQGEYTCNPKYIAEEILRRRLPYKITWVQRGQSVGPYPAEFEFVNHDSAAYFRAIAGAKVVIQNGHSMQRSGAQKGSSQYWLQTWHGSLGLKRLEGAGGDHKFYKRMRKLDNAQTDFVLTNSTFEDQVFTNTYWSDVPKPMLGHARNDILFDKSQETTDALRKKVLDRLGVVDSGQKFLLYAPTHNDDDGSTPLSGVDIVGLCTALAGKFGGTWEILIRTHHSNKQASDAQIAGLPRYCHNASFYPDMQELLMVADAGVTDYSSWICDYIHTGKPSFLFSTDLEGYTQQRGFYHDFADTPFTMATTNRQLLDNIERFDQRLFDQKISEFLKLCGSIDDGESASRIVDKIEELMAA